MFNLQENLDADWVCKRQQNVRQTDSEHIQIYAVHSVLYIMSQAHKHTHLQIYLNVKSIKDKGKRITNTAKKRKKKK